MAVGLPAAGAGKPDRREILEAEVGWVERVLAGEDQRRLDPAAAKRCGDRGKLDRFGAGTDCERNWSWQSSP